MSTRRAARGPDGRAEFGHHPRAAHSLPHLPAPAPQLTGHEGSGLLLVTAELGMAVDVASQLNQLRQLLPQQVFQSQALPVGRRLTRRSFTPLGEDPR